jgi:Fic family protein
MAGIGTLNAKLAQLKNPNLVIRPLQRREALQSSAMEGTYTTSDELALLEAGVSENVRADTREVLNYVTALTHAVTLMKTLPICHRLIQETHEKSGLPAEGKQKARSIQARSKLDWWCDSRNSPVRAAATE